MPLTKVPFTETDWEAGSSNRLVFPALTLNVVLELMFPEVAVIVVVPMASEEASPAELIVATVVFELAQLAVAVRSAVELSLKMPAALN